MLGADFDEDLFEGGCKQDKQKDQDKKLLVLSEGWFHEGTLPTEDEYVSVKFAADHQYLRGRYMDAVDAYQRVLQLLPSTNLTVMRDALEGLTRSMMGNEDYSGALSTARRLMKTCQNSEQLASSIMVMADVHRGRQEFQEELGCLHYYTTIHTINSNIWLRVAHAYASLYGIALEAAVFNKESRNRSKFAGDPIVSKVKNMCLEDETETFQPHLHVSKAFPKLVVGACLIRTRAILKSVQETIRSFVRQRNLQLQATLERNLEQLGLDESYCSLAYKEMTKGVFGESTIEEEFKDLGRSDAKKNEESDGWSMRYGSRVFSTNVISGLNDQINNFENVWFGWISNLRKT